MKLDLVKTNIVNVTADAIVLPANSMLKEGSGVSTVIFEAAGRKKLSQACKKIGYCEVGSAVPTLAFNMDAKYIIHTVVPRWIDGNHSEYSLLSSAYLSALQVADIMGCESIVFPLLASGNNGYDPKLAFEIARNSIYAFDGFYIKRTVLVLFGDEIVNMVKAWGYDVIIIPENLKKEELKQAHKAKTKKMIEDGKEIAHKFFEDQIQKGMNYLKVEKNREKILAGGIAIAKQAFQIVKKVGVEQ